MTNMKFQTGLSFASVYMKKSYWDGQKILVCNSLVKFCYFILKTNVSEKRSIEKQLLLTGTFNTLLLADSSTTSITYKLVMLLIKRRKFLVKLSESILYETDVCFKRKKYRRDI